MKRVLVAAVMGCCLSVFTVTPGFATEAKCLKCHEKEDFEGMNADDVFAAARNVEEHKRHKTNSSLSDEELRAAIEELLKPEG